MGILPPTGQMNIETTEMMIRKRCSNPDIEINNLIKRLKKLLFFSLYFYNFRFTKHMESLSFTLLYNCSKNKS